MESKEKFFIVGAKAWKGEVEGKTIDSAKLFAELSLDDSRNKPDQWASGKVVEEFRVPAALAVRVRDAGLPCLVELTLKRVAGKPGEPARQVVLDVQPIKVKADADGVLPLKAAAGR